MYTMTWQNVSPDTTDGREHTISCGDMESLFSVWWMLSYQTKLLREKQRVVITHNGMVIEFEQEGLSWYRSLE